ncbi:MAG TPA: carboxyl transferase domain-containing protein, partial [Solirubrobacteraceae bacterium]|nr:carboxyl transferase domain-containing protein [Solirubrobacteraceae bacterium]
DRARAPVVGFVASGGARMQEGVAALGGYGRIFRRIVQLSGRVPQISIITGLSAGGGAYSPALTDYVIMTDESSMFLTGPGVVREALGEEVTAADLGGTRVHERNGVCHFVARTEPDAARLARELIGYLPRHKDFSPDRRPPRPAPANDRDPSVHVPTQARRVYDVRDVIGSIVDAGDFLEISAGWARNLVTGLARIEGRTVGVIANQPRYLGGVLDCASSQKGARFVSKCNAFGIPLLVLVDTPGFMPGTKQEADGVIRFGATLVHAFAEATVPRVTLILRKAFGGAFITMNSKDLGADYVFAWPRAELGVMGAKPAVGIIHRRELAAADDRDAAREVLAQRYAEAQLRPTVAAASGHIDELIAPHETRDRLAWAFRSLEGTI